MAKTPALPPLSDADWPDGIADMRNGFAGALNVYRTMARHPDLLRAWAPLREHIVRNTALGPVRAEMVILRAGHRLGSTYEWTQHVLRARKVGLTDEEIASLRGPVAAMRPEPALFARAVDALIDHSRLGADLRTAVIAEVGEPGLIDLLATVGFYSTLGFLLNTTETPLDVDAAEAIRQAPFTQP